jgi:unsaturated rhamnogalacturonyl hydrolase
LTGKIYAKGKFMRTKLFHAVLLVLLVEPVRAEAPAAIAELEVGNPSKFARPDTLVRVSLQSLGVTEGPFQVWEGETARSTQLIDEDGDGRADSLAFLADLGPAATHHFKVDRQVVKSRDTPRAHAEISIKEGGAWQDKKYVGGTFKSVGRVEAPPQATDHSEWIRYEGPGIESDQVGYRVYLDWRNGFDIFGKKTSAMVLPQVGLDGYESYHHMADWGADILKVGQSLGMGGFGYWDGQKTVLVSKVAKRSASILSDGPIQAAFGMDFVAWETGKATFDLNARLSMQAGSPLVDVALESSVPVDNLAVGLVIHPKAEVLQGNLDIPGETWSYLATFGPQSLFEGESLGMVVFFKKLDLDSITRDEQSQVVVLKPRNTRLSYAFGALWSGRPGGVSNREQFAAFLEAEVERRTLAPRVHLATAASRRTSQLSPLEISKRLAESEMARRGDSLGKGGWDAFATRPSVWNYTTGLLMQSLDDLATATGERRYADFARRTIDSYLAADGTIDGFDESEYNIDAINSGKMLQRLAKRDPDPKYKGAIAILAKAMANHPRTSEGAFWHKQKYPYQLWLDGVYMGMPFLAGVGVERGDDHLMAEAVKDFTVARARLRDGKSGLYYHAWDEARKQIWADPTTGRSHYFWGRGLGWYAMALVDILDVIPPEKKELRAPLLEMIPELAEGLVRHQDETGTWWQILDKPGEPGNYREASATAMFTYFLIKGINKGYLPQSYLPAARKAYAGLVAEFVAIHADGSFHLTNNVETAGLGYGRDGSYRYYMSERVVDNDPKGFGPAIMAGIEAAKLPKAP